MKVSVVVPVYNVSGYLNKCVDSICNNTYQDIEIILVDDGSSDGSEEICDDYKKRDNRIIVVHKENGGLSSARNAGTAVATGEYVCFIDSDDYIEENMIEVLIGKALETEADIVQCGFDRVDEYGNVKSRIKVEDWNISGDEIIRAYYTQSRNMPVIVCNKLFTRNIVASTPFIEGRNNEDNMFGVDILPKVKVWASVDRILYHYLIRDNSIMGATFSEKKFDAIYANKYVLKKTKEFAPQYINYVHYLRSLNSFYLYYSIWNSSTEDKKKYYDIVLDEFSNSYPYITNDMNISKKDKIRLKLFSKNPNFAMKIYKKIRKI